MSHDQEAMLEDMQRQLDVRPADWALRLVLSDLLDEMGRGGEAEVQRWLVKFRRHPRPVYDYDRQLLVWEWVEAPCEMYNMPWLIPTQRLTSPLADSLYRKDIYMDDHPFGEVVAFLTRDAAEASLAVATKDAPWPDDVAEAEEQGRAVHNHVQAMMGGAVPDDLAGIPRRAATVPDDDDDFDLPF